MFISNQIYAVDHHHGQASRTIFSGYPAILGKTMREKAAYYLEHLSWIHESLIREPRGHRNMLGAILTEPVTEGAAYGILFNHAFGLFDSCGDSTFAAASALVELGLVPAVAPTTRFVLDTVLGPINIEVQVEGGVVKEARFENVPSYDVGRATVKVPELGDVSLDIGFGGQYHGFVDANALGLKVDRKNEAALVTAANQIWAAGGRTIDIRDPENDREITLNLVSFISKGEDVNTYHVAHVYPPGRMGRTPGGTGTSALMGLLAARGQYDPSQRFTMRSVLGLDFTGTGTSLTMPKGAKAIRPKLGTKSYMMGIQHFVIDPADPFKHGFVLEG
jgi:proline racemase